MRGGRATAYGLRSPAFSAPSALGSSGGENFCVFFGFRVNMGMSSSVFLW